jgi:hypothetical protein
VSCSKKGLAENKSIGSYHQSERLEAQSEQRLEGQSEQRLTRGGARVKHSEKREIDDHLGRDFALSSLCLNR